MLGHVAQSVGGALPGVGGGNPLLGQALLTADGQTVTTPHLASWAFVELQGHGAHAIASTSAAGAGGAASDAIVAVSPGDVISTAQPYTNNNVNAVDVSTLSVQGVVVLQAESPPSATIARTPQAGPSGKYPGKPSTGGNAPGLGGGRLSGRTTGTLLIASSVGAGASGGTINGNQNITPGGRAMACVTFFTSYEAALAFANSLYGGNWQP